jgi:hypothetical protein
MDRKYSPCDTLSTCPFPCVPEGLHHALDLQIGLDVADVKGVVQVSMVEASLVDYWGTVKQAPSALLRIFMGEGIAIRGDVISTIEYICLRTLTSEWTGCGAHSWEHTIV